MSRSLPAAERTGEEVRRRQPASGRWGRALAGIRRRRVGLASGLLLLALAILALLAPVVSHYGPADQDLDHVFAGFSLQHPLGTDELGRDMLTRLAYGARVSLGVAGLTVSLSMLIGGGVGIVAGYYGRLVDDVLMRLVDMLLATPTIYLLILLGSLLPVRIGPVTFYHDPVSISILLAITSWGGAARLLRGATLAIRNDDFMLATASLGAGDARLILRHLVPNVMPTALVVASLSVSGIILTEAALDYIGIGVQPPTPSWGNMLSQSQVYFYHSVWLVVLPGLAVVMTAMATNLLANAVRDALDPRVR